MSTPVRIVLFVLGGVAVLLLLFLGGMAALNRHPADVGPGTAIQYDDFAFSVQDWRTARSVGAVATPGLYYVVDLRVENRARRVDFQFREDSAVLRDAAGGMYPQAAAAQSALDQQQGGPGPCAAPLAAGCSGVRTLVFEAPGELEDPQIQVACGGTGLFALLDDAVYGRKRIHLR